MICFLSNSSDARGYKVIFALLDGIFGGVGLAIFSVLVSSGVDVELILAILHH